MSDDGITASENGIERPDAAAVRGVLSFDFRRVALAIAFFYFATPFDFAGSKDAGYELISLVALALLLSVMLFAVRPYIVNRSLLTFSIVLAVYVLALNATGLSTSTFAACFLMVWGIVTDDPVTTDFRRDVIWVLTTYLVVHLVGLGLSEFFFWTGGMTVDIHHVLFPWSAARQDFEFGVARLSGFQIEPGTYAAWMYLVMTLRMLLVRRVATWLHTIVVLSMMFTLAAWAGMAVGCYVVAAGLEFLAKHVRFGLSRRSAFIVAAIAVVAFVVVAEVVATQAGDKAGLIGTYYLFLQARLTTTGAGSANLVSKVVYVQYLMAKLGDVIFIGRPFVESFCPQCNSVQDLGAWTGLLYHIGLIPSVLLLGALVVKLFRNFGISFLAAFVPVFLAKADFTYPLLWLIVGTALFSPRPERNIPDALRQQPEIAAPYPS